MNAPRLSAGVVVFRLDGGAPRCLVLRVFSNWDFPKGMVEAGELPFAAAQREVREETTLTRLAFPFDEEFIETPPYGRGKVARYYLAVCDEYAVHLPVNPLLGHPEHHAYRWVDCSAAVPLLVPRLQPVLAWACERIGTLPRQRD